MGLSTLAGDEIDSGPIDVRPTPAAILATTVSAALRAAAAVVAGLALVSGAALVLWAVTPGDGSDSSVALRGGAVAFAAAHFLPVSFSGVAVTIKPLLLTGLMIAVIATSAGRARMVRGRLLEALHASVFVLFYAVGVDVASALLAPRGTVEPGLAAPLIVAAVGAVLALAFHPSAWRASWRDRAPGWLQIGLRAGVTALGSLLTIGAVVLLIGLVAAFPHVVRIAELTVRSPGDALGMALLCLALLPNAVLAAVGYVSGAGFAIGDAHFSPLAVHQADLPAVPLLAATPDHALSAGSWAILAGPVLAAVLAGIVIVRESEDRWTRLIGCGAAAVCVGLLCAALVGAAGGGVAGGPWASAGAPPLLTAGIAATVTLLVAGALSVSVAWRAIPWSVSNVYDADDDVSVPGDAEASEPTADPATGLAAEPAADADTADAPEDAANDTAQAADDAAEIDAEDEVDSDSAAEPAAETAGDTADGPEDTAEVPLDAPTTAVITMPARAEDTVIHDGPEAEPAPPCDEAGAHDPAPHDPLGEMSTGEANTATPGPHTAAPGDDIDAARLADAG